MYEKGSVNAEMASQSCGLHAGKQDSSQAPHLQTVRLDREVRAGDSVSSKWVRSSGRGGSLNLSVSLFAPTALGSLRRKPARGTTCHDRAARSEMAGASSPRASVVESFPAV